jgi:multiple sugar transport system permease protein
MDSVQLNHEGLQFIPNQFNLHQYYLIITDKASYFRYFFNSAKITIGVISGQVLISLFGAYGLYKMPKRLGNVILSLYVFALLLPFQVTLIPNYIVFETIERLFEFEIIDTHMALILPGIFSSLGIFLLRQFMQDIPSAYLEAAEIDGATNIQILFKVILPLLRPAIISLVVLVFIDNWNLIEQSLVFIKDPVKEPLSVFLEKIYNGDLKVFYAGSVLYMVPTLMIFYKGEKYIKEGIMTGGIK